MSLLRNISHWVNGQTINSEYEPMSEWTYHTMWKWANEWVELPWIVNMSKWVNGTTMDSEYERINEWNYHGYWLWANEWMELPWIVKMSKWVNGTTMDSKNEQMSEWNYHIIVFFLFLSFDQFSINFFVKCLENLE